MLTVPEAAKRVGKDPETVRRWIRSGRLRSQRIGTQHMIDEAELDDVVRKDTSLRRPERLAKTRSGLPMPDSVGLIRELRDSR